MIKAFSVALGVTFSFGVYTTATTMMSFIISPVGVFLVLSVVYGIIGLLGQRNFKDTILTAVIVSMHAKVIEYSLEGILRRGNFKKWWIEKLKSQKDDENIVIRNESHLKALESAIKQSKNNVFIYSGWLNIAVVKMLREEMQKGLSRGINIYIGYGWQYPSGQDQKSLRETEAISMIEKINDSTEGSGRIVCKKFPNHSKVLICDEVYAICGSANWMSNSGYHNREVSIKITSKKLIHELLDEAKQDFNEEK